MDITNEDGTLDLDAARRETGKLASARNADDGKVRANTLLISTLLDVAESLRILATESLLAMQEGEARDADLEDDFGSPLIRARTFEEHLSRGNDGSSWLEPGDVVALGGDAIMPPLASPKPGVVVAVGHSEGEMWADVDFDPMGDEIARVFQRFLIRLVGDEAPHVSTPEEDAAMIDADDAPELFEDGEHDEPDAALIAEGLGDDLDDDFDGDEHPDAEDAVAKLAAAEAERKAKKAKSKKGSKA